METTAFSNLADGRGVGVRDQGEEQRKIYIERGGGDSESRGRVKNPT